MRVVAALSGGVDSSVAALRLVRGGHEVLGLFMRLMDGEGGACCNRRAGRAARRVADRLSIPFVAADYAAVFHETVVAPALADLAAGLTPNPCVSCNAEVKFGALLAQARRMGAGALCTGHYARLKAGRDGPELHESASAAKDQTYFLWPLRSADLDSVLFPLGDVKCKERVRAEALAAGLPTALAPESQDLCFAPDGLARLLAERPGAVLDTAGREVGRHRGQHTVTLGQRRGLGVALGHPVRVVAKDAQANTVTVAPGPLPGRRRVALARVNWLARP
ncbi:tRNA 2-thiouridine(34) synthase MnmA, partial [bacterium]|nr:tRNA 2-thiouridine(34) synthase MnmA [bacterium]